MKNFLITSGFKLDYSLLPKVLLDVLFAFVLLFCNSLQAKAEETTTSVLATTEIMQKKTITGKVVDTNGEPIIGANVSIKGTTTGTITDPDGNFSLAAPTGTVLQISYIGFLTQSGNYSGGVLLSFPEFVPSNNCQVILFPYRGTSFYNS